MTCAGCERRDRINESRKRGLLRLFFREHDLADAALVDLDACETRLEVARALLTSAAVRLTPGDALRDEINDFLLQF